MNPIPRVDSTMHPGAKDAFPAPCYDPNAPDEGGHGGLCSGWYGPDDLEIVDFVRVPAHITAGNYGMPCAPACLLCPIPLFDIFLTQNLLANLNSSTCSAPMALGVSVGAAILYRVASARN